MQSKNMLVTGAAGFIGSCFVKMMLSRYPELKVCSLDKLTYASNLKNLEHIENKENHQFFHDDILNEKGVLDILKNHDIDTIVHFAAESHVDNSIASPKQFIETNIVGTFNLLECARKMNVGHFHHISTDEVYGSLESTDPAFTEATPYAPNSPYSASKAGSDHLVRAYFHTYGLPVTISNCSNNYGPNQHREKFIPVVVLACLDQKKIPIYGDGKNIRDWLYVEDHCDAIDVILKKGRLGECYNIGGNNEVDNFALVKMICQIMDDTFPARKPHEKLIHYVTDRKGHDRRYAINNHKIQTELQWKPSHEFSDALKKTVHAYIRENVR